MELKNCEPTKCHSVCKKKKSLHLAFVVLRRSEMRMRECEYEGEGGGRGIAICLGDNLELASGKWMASRPGLRTEQKVGVCESSINLFL